MTKPSPFFARIKRDVLAIVATVPAGKLVTFKDIGAHLDVAPRHVAYILSQLDPLEATTVAWFRAVPDDGTLATPKAAPDGRTQAELLAAEGHQVTADGRILDLGGRQVAAGSLPHGVPVQTRPPDAPKASPRRTKKPL